MAYYFGKFYPQRPHRYAEYMRKDFKPFVKYWGKKDQKLINETLKFIMREEPDLPKGLIYSRLIFHLLCWSVGYDRKRTLN